MPASTAMSPRLRLHHLLLSILSALPTCPLDHSTPTSAAAAAAATASHHHVVTTLPGYDGELPFRLETGYVAVDEEEHGAELFYYFVESESGDPRRDPLLLWLTGGARCSVLSGVFFEVGPVRLALEHHRPYDAGELPRLRYHPHGWTKAASVLFVDSPVGAGWSFSRHPDGYLVGDVSASLQLKHFLAKWISDHPEYLANPFYIGGDSYAGKIVPFLAQKISEDIEAGVRPIVDLKGYLVGNPVTGESIDFDSRVPYAHGVGIISDQLYETIMEHCQGEDYSNPKNAICRQALDRFNEGSVDEWLRCHNGDLPYSMDIKSNIKFHHNVTTKGYRALVYSGDHDAMIPFLGTQAWVRSLNFSVVDDWRAWHVDGQSAGFTITYMNNMTFATVKGGSHTVPEFEPERSLAMFKRWISNEPL
ncbi:serine carboxypeptidase-like 3 [Oryza sativa Japonica Group]|uniref:serine carboxypeptidase-like 3 n=1 Tax=Oryza sativa subsp. japonica TaxID=39947 RepID=UPI00339C97D2